MSDHLDGLTAADDPRLDISDLYLFRGTTGTVFVLNTNPGGSDGFHHEAVYELRLHTGGGGHQDVTLRTTFGERGPRGRQDAVLSLLTGRDAGDRDAPGRVLARTTTGKDTVSGDGLRFWAGPAGDPFYIEPSVVTAVRTSVVEGAPLDLSGFDPAHPVNLFGGQNVHAIVIEVHDHFFPAPRQALACWGAVAVPTDAGDAWRQTDRAGLPLVSTLFGFNEGDEYNATAPGEDDARWGPVIERRAARALEANGAGHRQAAAHAAELRAALTPDVLRYRVGTPARFTGGRRNGRNLTENVAEEMFRLVLRRGVDMRLGPDAATGRLRGRFPYLAEPAPAA